MKTGHVGGALRWSSDGKGSTDLMAAAGGVLEDEALGCSSNETPTVVVQHC